MTAPGSAVRSTAEVGEMRDELSIEDLGTEGLESGVWGEWVDTTEYLRDDSTLPYTGSGPIDLRRNRKDGQNFPIFQTEQELAVIRGVGRALVDQTEWGTGALEVLSAFTMGTGYTWKAVPKKEALNPEQAAVVAARVKSILDELIRENSWTMDREDEFLKRGARDGEVFLAIIDGPDGCPRMRFVEPSMVTEPNSAVSRQLEEMYGLECGNWRFGIHTREGDVETVFGYFVQWSDSTADFSYIPASRMTHWKKNVDRNVKRGVSDFFPMFKTLPKAVKLLVNMVTGGSVQAAIAWILTLPEGTTKAQADTVVAANAQTSKQQVAGASVSARNATRYPAGSVITTREGAQYSAGPMGAERNQGFVEVLQAALRTVGIRWTMPEFMISGDASNANYASTLAAASPFGRARRRDQTRLGMIWTDMWRKAINVAFRKKLLESVVTSIPELWSLIELVYSAPDVQIQNDVEAVGVALQKLQLGVKRDVVLRELGYDPDSEAEPMAAGYNPAGGGDPAGPVPQADAALGTSRLQFKRNMAAINDILAQLQTGGSEARVQSLLEGVGLSPDRAAALIQDALDGTIDDTSGLESGRIFREVVASGTLSAVPDAPSRKMSETVESVVGIVGSVAVGTLPRDAGLAQLQEIVGLTANQAAAVMGSAGTGDAPEGAAIERALSKWWQNL